MANPLDNNPLLNPPSLPHGAPPLDIVKTEHFLPAIKAAIELARKDIAAIKTNATPPTFQNTIEAMEFAGDDLSRVSSIFDHFSSSHSNAELRTVEKKINPEKVKYYSDIMLDDDLFARVKVVYDNAYSLNLTSPQKMLLDNTYKGFVRSGALLDAKGKKRLREIDERLSDLATAFKDNTLESAAAYKKVIDNEKDLAGIPKSVKEEYAEDAKNEGLSGKWLIRLSPPPIEVLEYAENRVLREEIAKARSNIAYKDKFDNSPVVLEIVKLRDERAKLLGFANHAAFVLDERMAKTPKAVMEFLEGNAKVYRPAAEKHLQLVKDYALKTDGLKDFKPWDFAFYERKLKEEMFKVDMEDLKKYLNLEKVLEGVRNHTKKLFNVDLIPANGQYPVNHPDIKVYEVKDAKTGDFIGLFYADYYARSGVKRGGAWMDLFRSRGIHDGTNMPPIVSNNCNFRKPVPGQPTFISFDEMKTVKHEFGHGKHGLFGEGDYPSQNGVNVKWDFVELPSQLQENWATEKEFLDTFAVHHDTGEKISEELLQKIKAIENFGVGYTGLRQTFQAMLDMKWHTTDPATIKSVEELEDSVLADYWLFPRTAGPMSTQFSHLFSGGYSAGYYSYKWAEVLDADVFEEFKKKGLYNRELGDRLRDTIYSKGGNVDPMELFKQMMGREPDPNALFRREGLLSNDNKDTKPAVPRQPPRP